MTTFQQLLAKTLKNSQLAAIAMHHEVPLDDKVEVPLQPDVVRELLSQAPTKVTLRNVASLMTVVQPAKPSDSDNLVSVYLIRLKSFNCCIPSLADAQQSLPTPN